MYFFNNFHFRYKACLYGALTLLTVWVLILSHKFYSFAETTDNSVDIFHYHLGELTTNSGCYTVPKYHEHIGDDTGGGCYTTPEYHVHTGSTSGGGCYSSPNYHIHTGSSSGGGCYTSPQYHAHTGSSSGGGCYTSPQYHAHTGNSSGGGCYTSPQYHVHTGSSSGGGCYTSPNVHHHSGDSNSGGGCYTIRNTYQKQVGCLGGATYCAQGPYGPDTSGQVYYVGTCPSCLAHLSTYNSPGYATCPNARSETVVVYSLGCGMDEGQILSYSLGCNKSTSTIEYYNLGCGKTTSSIERYNIGCGKTTSTIERYNIGCGKDSSTIDSYSLGCGKSSSTIESYSLGCEKDTDFIEEYELGCGMGEDTPIGTFFVKKSSEEWAKEIELLISINPEELVDPDKPFSVNDNESGNTYVIKECGNYEVSANTIEGFSTPSITVEVNNIDNEGPRILSCEYDKSPDIASTTVIVTADDIMSNGDEGCGLDELAYSYDNGKSWTDDNTYLVKENCVIAIIVRDKLNNQSSAEVKISNIALPELVSNDDSLPDSSSSNDNAISNGASDHYSSSNNESNNDASHSLPAKKFDNLPESTTPLIVSTTKKPSSGKKTISNESLITKSSLEKPSNPVIYPDISTKIPQKESLEENIITTNNVEIPETDDFLELGTLIAAIIIGLIIALLLLLLMFLACRSVSIYNYVCDETYKLKGFALIHNKSDAYEINISEDIINKCDTNKMRLNFCPLFTAFHKNTDINVYSPNKRSYIIKPGRKIELKLIL